MGKTRELRAVLGKKDCLRAGTFWEHMKKGILGIQFIDNFSERVFTFGLETIKTTTRFLGIFSLEVLLMKDPIQALILESMLLISEIFDV